MRMFIRYICCMNRIFRIRFAFVVIGLISLLLFSCKSNEKEEPVAVTSSDTTSAFQMQPSNTLTLPHADSAVIPLLTQVLDEAFVASKAKDYNKLATLIVYRGPDEKRMGNDVYNSKNNFDKSLMKITADVFNKWNKDVTGLEYARAFELDQPDGRKMTVLEVIFVAPKSIDRKFFGFLQLNNEWKIADVTSYL